MVETIIDNNDILLSNTEIDFLPVQPFCQFDQQHWESDEKQCAVCCMPFEFGELIRPHLIACTHKFQYDQ